MHSRVWSFSIAFWIALSGVAEAATVTVEPGAGTPLADAVSQLAAGDKLVIKKGTYPERLVISGLADIKVVGKGKPQIGDGSTDVQVVAGDCPNISISGLVVVEGQGDSILIEESANATVSKCTVTNPAGTGIRFDNSNDGVVTKCSIGGASAVDAGRVGISGFSSDSLSVTKSRFTPGLRDGVSTGGGSDIVVSKNRFEGTTSRAVFIAAPGARCERNRMNDCEFGVRANGSGAVIAKNRVVRTGLSGGISVLSTDVVVSKNRVFDSEAVGIFVSPVATGVDVTRNVVRDVAFGGIVDNAPNSTVTRNKISNAGSNGLAARSDSGLYEKNVVKNSPATGMFVLQGGNTFRKNKVSGSGGFDLLSDVAEDANTFENNKFGTTSFP